MGVGDPFPGGGEGREEDGSSRGRGLHLALKPPSHDGASVAERLAEGP